MKVAVTGAGGFVGQALVCRLGPEHGHDLVALSRQPLHGAPAGTTQVLVPDVQSAAGWDSAFRGVEAVVHAAARVHVMRDTAADPLTAFRQVNVDGTLNVARQAARAGVRRFVFLSSVKVNGERTVAGRPFRPNDLPDPQDPYGVSKREAEDALRSWAPTAGIELVIIRPPLVYGPGAQGNFASLLQWLRRGRPLPLGAVHGNRRSFVGIDNLADLIARCITHPAAAGQRFLVSDGEDLSTTALLRAMGDAIGRPARLIPVPVPLLRLGAAALGRPGVAQRLCDSLQVDISDTRRLLAWSPPVPLAEGLRRAAGMRSAPAAATR